MVAVSGSILAVLAVTDPLKPEARGVVAALARRGLAVHLVTGDNWRTARAIAEQLAIVNVCAECLPGAKADKIKVAQHSLPWLRQRNSRTEGTVPCLLCCVCRSCIPCMPQHSSACNPPLLPARKCTWAMKVNFWCSGLLLTLAALSMGAPPDK